LAGAGLASIVVSLSAQQALSNIISGFLLIIYKPFKVGETIKMGDIIGKVEDIDLRQTTLIANDGNIVIIPNSIISSQTITKIVEK
jgi:small-conductance mechanosensitive channel